MNSAKSFPKSNLCLNACANRTHKAWTDDQGWALVAVLCAVGMLAMMAAATQALILSSAAMEKRVLEGAQAHAILDAAVTRAVLGISDGRIEQRWRVDGIATEFKYEGVVVRVKVQDQLGLIDLNAADGSLIKQLLLSAGLTDDAAASMTDKILDWRSATDLKRLHGASDADYASAGYPYHPRHGPFQSVSELCLVFGMTPDLYARIEPALTVYSGRPAFDPNTAPAEALRALYLNSSDQADTILSDRTQGSDAETQLGARPGVLSAAIPLAGRTFSISAELRAGSRRYKRDAVIELTEDDNRPYLILAWQ